MVEANNENQYLDTGSQDGEWEHTRIHPQQGLKERLAQLEFSPLRDKFSNFREFVPSAAQVATDTQT